MMAKVFLSPSTQEANQYSGGGTGTADSEEHWMRKVAYLAKPMLEAAGHTVKVGGTISAGASAKESNDWGAKWHIALHSDAGGGDGTTAFYYPGSTAGKNLATSVYKRVAKVSPGADNGVKSRDNLVELGGTNAYAALVELEFHDDKTLAAFIRTHLSEFAKAVAQGICDYIGGSIPSTPPVTPPPATPPATPVWKIVSQDATNIVLKKV